jgi:hypothetical protein
LLSLQRDVDETLSALAALGFTDGVRRISVPAPASATVPMAVIMDISSTRTFNARIAFGRNRSAPIARTTRCSS